MLKRLFCKVFALTFIVANLYPFTNLEAGAISEPIVFNNVLDLCNAMLSNGNWLDDSGTCEAYAEDQTSATISRIIYVSGDWILRNLDLTFTRSNSPFTILSGSLTIDSGRYSSPSCVVWIQYRDGTYTPSTFVTINAGIFEASVETAYSEDSPSPVCLITPQAVSESETQELINGYLPAGKHFIDIAPRLRARKATVSEEDDIIQADSGYAHIDKDGDQRTEVKYLRTTLVEVVGDTPEVLSDEPGYGAIEPDIKPEDETEEELEPTNTAIPKAPNTGKAKL